MVKGTFSIIILLAAVGTVFGADEAQPPKVTAQVINDADSGTNQAALVLDDVIKAALAKNPAVLSASHALSAERAKVPQARALPDPTFGVGWMGNARPFSVQTGDPSSYRSLSAMQMLPFPGKRSLRGQISGKEADATEWDLEGVRRRVAADAKAAYYD